MSSHITTDLEKVADYITFIHQGKVLFCKTKDELRYHYGIIRCGAAMFDQLDKDEILAYRKDDYQWNCLLYTSPQETKFSFVYNEIKQSILDGQIPVSYTHLDVYKRQM